MSPVPTRTSEPRNVQSKPGGGGGGDDIFAPIGKGIGDLFEEKGDKKGDWQIITPLGQKIHLPKGYSGQTIFRTREGRGYRLTFKDGALVMIEDETKPTVNQLKPGAGVAPGSASSTGKPAPTPGAPPPVEEDGEVPRPTGPRPPSPDE